MRNKIVHVAVVLCLATAVPSRADTPLDMLGLEKSINDVSRRAQETGDEIAKAFANQALEIIKAWKEANKDLINTAFDRLDQQSQALFTELQNTATRLEKAEAVTFIDLQRTLANAGASLGGAIPGGSDQPQFFFYWPSVALPKGEKSINVRVVGTNIANGDPTVTVGGRTLPVKKYSDNEVGFDLDRSNLKVGANEVEPTVFPFRYQVGASTWYNPLSWWSKETRHRDLEIRTLPANPGSATVTFQVREDGWEYANLLPEGETKWVILGGPGQDAPYDATYTLTPERQEQGWVIDKTSQKAARWDDNNGDGNGGSSCVSFNEGAFTDKSFTFRIQHGHVGSFKKSDAHQNCRIFDIFVKRPKLIEDEQKSTAALDWLVPAPVKIPANSHGYNITLSLYTGRSYPITDKKGVPYDLFDVVKTDEEIIFQPREQRGF
jgi:hypothetical protein